MKKILIVIGMHRSGTSALAGILKNSGVHFPDSSDFNRFNKKGNQEAKFINEFHDIQLINNNSSWDSPPTEETLSFDNDSASDLLDRLFSGGENIIGVKDPRMLLFINQWANIFKTKDVEPIFIATFRNPNDVAASLFKRDKFEQDKSFKVWQSYNKKLCEFSTTNSFPIICYSTPINFYLSEVGRTISNLNKIYELDLDPRAGLHFFANDLKNNSSDVIPDQCISIWNELLDRRFNFHEESISC